LILTRWLNADNEETARVNEFLRSIFSATVEGIVVYDQNGWLTDANRAAEQLLGLDRKVLVGSGIHMPPWQPIREDGSFLAPAQQPAAITLITRRAVRASVMGIHTSGGEIRWFSVTSQITPTEESPFGPAVVVTFVEVTALRNSYRRIRELAQRLETVREEERRTVARMLHDGIAQELSVTLFRLNRLETQSDRAPTISQLCLDLRESLRRCIAELRQGADELRPSSFSLLTLPEALREHAQSFGEVSGLQIQIKEQNRFPDLDEDTRLLFFRAAQEALTNVARHARGTEADISLEASENYVTMEVSDNGVGIPEGAIDKPGSFGLLGLRERFAALGGDLTLHEIAPSGTRLRVSLPCTKTRRSVQSA
jgi:two-component system, NarL family, sensor histidine kinase UhpB